MHENTQEEYDDRLRRLDAEAWQADPRACHEAVLVEMLQRALQQIDRLEAKLKASDASGAAEEVK
ncbi:MAG: hypothetical protein GY873_26130 [Bosea sp.]|uniref:hypothetical protein n=1 Tax=Bosea sp. (in: a-proteobacteria) TaxID=1871050 RepID=UPI00238A881A|nr:hypothetical protein [Bosea sp. (in: a-proteobacteria)]